MKDLYQKAHSYAVKGWFVVPDHGITEEGRCTCSDPACKTEGKHPRIERTDKSAHIRREGSRNLAQIKAWWEEWPNSNVAIVCGKHSNLVVVDVDKKNGGLASWEALEKRHGKIATLTVLSGGGGKHLYFSHPGYSEVRNRIGLRPGIDIRADGGRIVAPPSRHKSGNRYRWEDPEATIAKLPAWLFRMIQFEQGTGTRKYMRARAGF